jgi:UDP-GlcNAc:undecaprenyl-phosphate/decaprenyl-phosphate GlcNAc-1-phosphate transferase
MTAQQIVQLLWLTGECFLIALFLTPVVRDVARAFNIVDHPSSRKIHAHPIPRLGGVAIAVAYVAVLLSIPKSLKPFNGLSAWEIIPGATIVFLTGVLDDIFDIKPLLKIGGLVTAASVVYWSGLRIGQLAEHPLSPWLDFPLTVFWLLLTSNALNLIDGLDGLCAGMGMLSTLALCAAAISHHNLPLAFATAPLFGALLGFLRYNVSPATIFLGDSGALLVGFLLGCYGMTWTQKTSTLLSLLVPLLALSIPLLDISLSVMRRFLRKQPIFTADREHIHHRLLDRGLSPRQAMMVLYGVALLGGVFAFAISTPLAGRYQGFVVLVFCLIAAVGVRQLHYREFAIPTRLFFRGVRQKLTVERLAHLLESARDETGWWEQLTEVAGPLGLVNIRLAGEAGIRRQWHISDQPAAWSFRVPLRDCESIEMEGSLFPGAATFDLIRLAEIMRTTFPDNRSATTPVPAGEVASVQL